MYKRRGCNVQIRLYSKTAASRSSSAFRYHFDLWYIIRSDGDLNVCIVYLLPTPIAPLLDFYISVYLLAW